VATDTKTPALRWSRTEMGLRHRAESPNPVRTGLRAVSTCGRVVLTRVGQTDWNDWAIAIDGKRARNAPGIKSAKAHAAALLA
jgi:hypothetical protein